MILTDTHLHLYSEEYEQQQGFLLKNALDKGVSRFFLPNIDKESIGPMKAMKIQFPENVFMMMGLHPCYVKEDYKQQLGIIYEELKTGNYIAVGEIGTDLYWDKSTLDIQKEAFITQCNWAIDFDLPVAIHCRDSFGVTIEMVEEIKQNHPRGKKLRGVFHCFSGNSEDAKRAIKAGFYLGIGGVVTFKNSGLATVVENTDLKYLVLETDGPYLAPAPHRGKRNEPEYIYLVTQKIAEIKNCSIEEVAEITTKNSQQLFSI